MSNARIGRKLFAATVLGAGTWLACARVEGDPVEARADPPVTGSVSTGPTSSPPATSSAPPVASATEWTRPLDCAPAATVAPPRPEPYAFAESSTATWRTVASLPGPMSGLAMVSLTDGRALAFTPAGTLIYDPDLDLWSAKASLPPGWLLAASADDGVVNVLTYYEQEIVTHMYFVAEDRWANTGSLPGVRFCRVPAGVALGRRAFLIAGGARESEGKCVPSQKAYQYQLDAAPQWTGRGIASFEQQGLQLIASDDARVVLATYRPSGPTPPRHELFDVERNEWSKLPPISFDGARFEYMEGTSFAVPGGDIMIAGATDGKPYWDLVTPYARFDARCRTWRPAAWLPQPLRDAPAVRLPDGRVMLAGGYAYTTGRGLYEARANSIYDPARDAWVGTPAGRSSMRHGAAAVKGGVLIAGGSPGGCGTFCSPTEFSDAFVLRP